MHQRYRLDQVFPRQSYDLMVKYLARDQFPLHLGLANAIYIHHAGRVRCKPGPRIAAKVPRRPPSRKLIKHKLEEP